MCTRGKALHEERAGTTTRALIEELVSSFGAMKLFSSGGGPLDLFKMAKNPIKKVGTGRIQACAFHSQRAGRVQRRSGVLAKNFTCFMSTDDSNWY